MPTNKNILKCINNHNMIIKMYHLLDQWSSSHGIFNPVSKNFLRGM